MTISTTNKPNWNIALGLPFLIFLSCFLITFSKKFNPSNELLSNGILADLLITAPLVYFLAIRKSNVSKLTTTSVFIVGLLFAGFILRTHTNPHLEIIKTWVLPIIEVFILLSIFKKFYIISKNAKEKNNKVDFLIHCRSIMLQITRNEKVANVVSSEVAVIYYAFFSTNDKSIDYKTKFTTYKENDLTVVLSGILPQFSL